MSALSLLGRLAETRAVLARRVVARLDRPVRPFALVMGWIGSTVLFLLVATGLGGPTEGDSSEVVYGTWAIAHGHLGCVYPVVAPHLPLGLADPFALAAPLYPILAGVVAAVLRIGHTVPFPSGHALGPDCVHGFTLAFRWSSVSGAILPTVRLGYLTWVVVLAGATYLVRGTSRRGTGWEVATGFLLAVAPPIVMCITYYFHPQDLLAMGLVLFGLGATVRDRTLAAGVWLGLALTAQQFAVLAIVALLVLVGRARVVRLLAGVAAAVLVVDGPFVAVSGFRAVKTVLLGSSRVGSDIAAHGGTVVFSLGLTGIPDFLLARVTPIVAAALVAWLVGRTTTARPLRPYLIVAAVTAALSCRLVFEVNLFGYYFMACAVGLLLGEVLRGQVGRDVLAFAGLFVVGMNPEHIALISNLTTYGLSLYYDLPIVVLGLGVLTLLYDAVRRRFSPTLVLWLALVTLAGQTHLFGRYNPYWSFPEWAWQIVLVGYLVAILARRLRWAASEEAPVEELVAV